jgi:hypothetical protein
MAKSGPTVVTVTIDDAPGGTPRIITPYVDTIGDLELNSITEETNPFGATSKQNTPVGIDETPDIPLEGWFDDTAILGPHVVFGTAASWALDKAPGSVGRVLAILAATGKTFTITVHLVKYAIVLKKDGLTRYKALVRQKSAGVWS